jgi:hypothetical protein
MHSTIATILNSLVRSQRVRRVFCDFEEGKTQYCLCQKIKSTIAFDLDPPFSIGRLVEKGSRRATVSLVTFLPSQRISAAKSPILKVVLSSQT